jgi:hypothetical protein
LGLACWQNTNLAIIKYLIEDHKMDLNHVNKHKTNYIALACRSNTNLQVIKYLIEVHKMDINHINEHKDNCLTMACWKNTNLAVIKYLIEDQKMDINHVDRCNNNCLTVACQENINLQVIKYLIKEHQMNIENLNDVLYDKFKDIVLTISKEYRELNNLLLTGYKIYTIHEMKNLIKLLNPLQLNDAVLNLSGIQNPLLQPDYKFSKFARLVDELLYGSELSEKQIKVKIKKNRKKRKKQNRNDQELLFVHNNKEYYGDRNKVYGSIQVLNDLWDQYDMTESIVLEGSLPCYAINQYIEACSGTPFNLENIHENDFISFLKFIDQYPAVQISIRGIEDQIIQYVTRYNTKQEAYFKTIYARYDLKKLYLWIHNLKLASKSGHQE